MLVQLHLADSENKLWKTVLAAVSSATLTYVSRSLIRWYQRFGLEAERQKLRDERTESLQRARKKLEEAKVLYDNTQ